MLSWILLRCLLFEDCLVSDSRDGWFVWRIVYRMLDVCGIFHLSCFRDWIYRILASHKDTRVCLNLLYYVRKLLIYILNSYLAAFVIPRQNSVISYRIFLYHIHIDLCYCTLCLAFFFSMELQPKNISGSYSNVGIT